jgi:hypothetical protein
MYVFGAVQQSLMHLPKCSYLSTDIEEIGQTAHAYAEHAGRIEANFYDVWLYGNGFCVLYILILLLAGEHGSREHGGNTGGPSGVDEPR